MRCVLASIKWWLNSLNSLNILKIFDKNYFKVIYYINNIVVIYTKYNQLWVPKCYSMDIISSREILKMNASCTEGLPVQFRVDQMLVNGFMDANIIGKSSTKRFDCSIIEQLYFLNGSIINRSCNKVVLIINNTLISRYTALNIRSFNISKDKFLQSKIISDGLESVELLKYCNTINYFPSPNKFDHRWSTNKMVY